MTIKITFGIISLNSLPFLEYNIRALYPFAHEIIVVEGAVRAAAPIAREDGHSLDGTAEWLETFCNEEDVDRKVKIIFAEHEGYDSGFWPEKEEMSRAYATRASGDWLWQVDADEFYLESDIAAVISMLEQDPTIDMVSFPYLEFFGNFDTLITGTWHLKEYTLCHRLFKWRPGYEYESHRPSTVADEHGVNLREKKWVKSPKNQGQLIYMFHYSYVLPKQAEQKVGYYANVEWTEAFRQNQSWLEKSYFGLASPMFLSEKGWPNLQWLERYTGPHPRQIVNLQRDLASGNVKEAARRNDDIDRLLRSPLYAFQRAIARVFLMIFWPIRGFWKQIRARIIGA